MSEEKKDGISSLREKLYSRTDGAVKVRHSALPEHELKVQNNWTAEEIRIEPAKDYGPMVKKIFIGSLIFFLLSIALALFIYFGGFNLVSTNNISVHVVGPVSVNGGETVSLEVIVANENNADLEMATMLVEFPDKTRDPKDLGKPLTRSVERLGLVKSGGSVRKKVEAVFFGEEQSAQEVRINIEYRVKGSNAIFSKEKTYDFILASSPVTLSVDALKEINSNEEFTFDLDVVSNSSSLIKNIIINAEYPFGFTFISSVPKPILGENTWSLGDIKPGDKATIRIKGKVLAQDNEERTWKFNAGVGKANETDIVTPLAGVSHTAGVKKPFVSTELVLNGESRDVTIKNGTSVKAEINWTNTLGTAISDLVIEAKLSGAALDRQSVSAENGFFRSLDDTIVWDKNTLRDFALVEPGGSGSLSFQFTPRALASNISSAPEVVLTISVRGSRPSDENVPVAVSTSISKKVKIYSDISFIGRMVHFTGPIKNSGPLPPQADKTTTYTVIWTITNRINDISNIKVRAKLPTYVNWNSNWSPSTENLTYDQESREVIWDIGLMKKSGSALGTKEVAFQIAFTPSVAQIGQTPILIGDAELLGKDIFTGDSLRVIKSSLNTKISSDPNYSLGQEIVRK